MTKFVHLPGIRSLNDISTFRKICDELEFSAQNLKPLKVEANIKIFFFVILL